MKKFTFLIILISCTAVASAQTVVRGTLYGEKNMPLQGAGVRNIRTNMLSVTAENGTFSIQALPGDTLLLTAMGYIPAHYTAQNLPEVIFLRTLVTELPGVEIIKRTRRKDSLATREEYHAAFNFRRPKFREVMMITPVGIGINIHKLYKALSFSRNRRSDVFKSRLINYEHERFIDERFNAALITMQTGLMGDSLTRFMNTHRPAYEFAADASDYDLIIYIRAESKKFRTPAAALPSQPGATN